MICTCLEDLFILHFFILKNKKINKWNFKIRFKEIVLYVDSNSQR
jgi:hypothetical protein